MTNSTTYSIWVTNLSSSTRLLDGTIYDRRIGDPNADPAFDKEKFKNDLVNYRNRPDTARRENIRKLERTGLAHGRRQPVDDGKHYLCYTKFGGEVPAAGWWMEEENPVSHVSRVERLTEIQYITGIRRLDMSESQPLGSFTGEEGIGTSESTTTAKGSISEFVLSGSKTRLQRTITHWT